MKKINHKMLSLPPYISTSWKNINALHMKAIEGKQILVVALHNGSTIEIPDLDSTVVEQVFSAHSKYLEQETQGQSESLKHYEPRQNNVETPFSIGIPFQISGGSNAMEHFGAFLHHNSEQSDAADLPPEIIQKITGISKALGMNLEQMNAPKAEPHCNCTYCQIARAIQTENFDESDQNEEIISDDDLKFRDWDIKQKSAQLYEVVNPIDQNEHYQVFLGNPVGCTCGQKNCEHIRTVLNS